MDSTTPRTLELLTSVGVLPNRESKPDPNSTTLPLRVSSLSHSTKSRLVRSFVRNTVKLDLAWAPWSRPTQFSNNNNQRSTDINIRWSFSAVHVDWADLFGMKWMVSKSYHFRPATLGLDQDLFFWRDLIETMMPKHHSFFLACRWATPSSYIFPTHLVRGPYF